MKKTIDDLENPKDGRLVLKSAWGFPRWSKWESKVLITTLNLWCDPNDPSLIELGVVPISKEWRPLLESGEATLTLDYCREKQSDALIMIWFKAGGSTNIPILSFEEFGLKKESRYLIPSWNWIKTCYWNNLNPMPALRWRYKQWKWKMLPPKDPEHYVLNLDDAMLQNLVPPVNISGDGKLIEYPVYLTRNWRIETWWVIGKR